MAKIQGVSANYKLIIRHKSHNKFHFNEKKYKISLILVRY